MSTDPPSVAFDAVIAGSPTKTGIPVPNEVLDQLDAGQRPAVVVTLDGYTYQTSVGVMGGQHLAAGSHVQVTLALAAGPSQELTATLDDPRRCRCIWERCR